MLSVDYKGHRYFVKKGETILECLRRQGADISFSCQNGVCQVCMLKTKSRISSIAQKGLSNRQVREGYFLACMHKPNTSMVIENDYGLEEGEKNSTSAVLFKSVQLTDSIWKVSLQLNNELMFFPGQFINLRYNDLIRSYSIANLPNQENIIELIVRHFPSGRMSSLLCNDIESIDSKEKPYKAKVEPLVFTLSSAKGECYYQQSDRHRELVLVSTGSGFANTWAILQSAIHANHSQSISFIHGVSRKRDLIFKDYLESLARQRDNFKYIPCVSREDDQGVYLGRVTDIAFKTKESLDNTTIYIAGSTDMVKESVKQASLAGADKAFIRTDFHSIFVSDLAQTNQSNHLSKDEANNQQNEKDKYPEADLVLWEALEKGKVLRNILEDFYDCVFDDPVLSPYFHNSTKERAKEKVYSFYRRIISGELIYFGDRPRNAHHWMVISDRIFDYRLEILVSTMKRHGLDDEMVVRWLKIEEFYRKDIVKTHTWGRRVGDVELPSEGFAKEVLDVGSICDACEQAIDAGEEVSYHLRTGKIYCRGCSADKSSRASALVSERGL